ncbi:hypothetical protein [Tatumella sp. OPLPL6]|uniref:hypothetical protein n=1 Tax=Tatumella sp. OPLPL6 TaxID=1928657 RepID=UPI000C5815EC|nr:hypothetical protein [Tatumella sp. OPLPL6]PIJ42550.1 hypothetical protein BOM24_11935 [Tatumella sp. OPLPL6]
MDIEMVKYIISPILLSLCFTVQAIDKKESMLQDFIINAENCQHLASEWDSSLPQVQQRDIEKQIDIVCPTTRQLREVIKRRYQDDKKTMDIIENYDF